MKKILIFILIMVMVTISLSGCGMPNEEDREPIDIGSIKTVGDILALEDANEQYSFYYDILVYAFEMNDGYYRAKALIPKETSEALWALDYNEEDYNEKYTELVSALEISEMEDLTGQILSQEEMDAFVGMTGRDLQNAGFSVTGRDLATMHFFMEYGPFLYDVVFDSTVDEADYDSFSDEEDIKEFTVKSMGFLALGDATNIENDAEEPIDWVPETFEFQPKVASTFLYELFGETMVNTWFNVVDAVLAGEDTFDCPDENTYDWVMGQFPDRCFPVFIDLIESGGFSPDGKGHIIYKKSKEETAKEIEDFEKLITDILSETIKHDYSDLEKALSLYDYFGNNYTYDYDTYYKMAEESLDYIWSYRFFTEKTGICQEISTAYSYLLMQVGVDATIMMGQADGEGDNHQWSYVKINGKNYHIDPTYNISSPSLSYFMMTDERRSIDYLPENFVISSVYSQEHDHPDYVADDDTFSPLWDHILSYFDHDTHNIHYYEITDDGDVVFKDFDYEGY